MGARERLLRRGALVVGLALALFAYAARVWHVEAHAIRYPIELYAVGERVALAGAFVDTVPPENSEGYSVVMRRATATDAAGYLARHGVRATELDERERAVPVIDVELEITNDSSLGGDASAVNVFGWLLSCDADDSFYLVDTGLWSQVERGVSDDQTYVALHPHTSYVVSVPFSAGIVRGDEGTDAVRTGRYALSLTSIPARKTIGFDLASRGELGVGRVS